MLQNITVVGCGTIGSNLCIELAKNKIEHLKIYDSDTISFEVNDCFIPFIKQQSKLYKIDVVKFLVKLNSNNFTNVSVFNKNINKSLNDESFIIDCRDRKETYINPDLEISLDGSILHLNSVSRFGKKIERSSLYVFEKCEYYLVKSLKIIINYLKNKEYEFKEFRDYDLTKDGVFHIIEV